MTISYYDTCQDYICTSAAVGMGQNSSGRYFARLLRFSDRFDVEGFNSVGDDRYVGHGVNAVEMWYAEPHPLDPGEGEWHFLVNTGEAVEQRYTTRDYGTPIVGGRLLVAGTRTQDDGTSHGGGMTTDWGIVLDPVRVTTTPEPMTLVLVGSGLMAVLVVRRRRRER